MNIDIGRLINSIRDELLKSQYKTDNLRRFVEVDRTKDFTEFSSVSVMSIKIRTEYIGNDEKILKSIYNTTRKAVTKILSKDKEFCFYYQIMGGYVIAFFNTYLASQVDELLEYAALLNSILSVVHHMIKEKYGASLSSNIGIEIGRVLRANEHLNEYTTKESFHGYPINNAINYSNMNINEKGGNVIISNGVRQNLKVQYQGFFKEYDDKCFVVSLFNTKVSNYIKEHYK